MALPWGGGSVDELEVRALTNESHVAFRLSWQDPTNDTSLTAPERYSDAAAVMLKGGSQPPITMGAVGEPVNIWYWRASWQFNDTRAEWTGDMYAYPHNDSLTMPGRQAGNPLSRASYETYGQNYYAKGFGSLSDAPHQNVRASATRTDEEWTVTFVRERSTDGTYDAAFGEHDNIYLAFAVWNGSADEVNGQKSITLQYSTLDTKSGELSAAQAGGSGGGSGSAGDAGGGSGDGTSGDGAGGGSPVFGWTAVLVTVALFTWVAVYWRVRP
jgi:DMSO reductase family type II enzyme heme b subunit